MSPPCRRGHFYLGARSLVLVAHTGSASPHCGLSNARPWEAPSKASEAVYGTLFAKARWTRARVAGTAGARGSLAAPLARVPAVSPALDISVMLVRLVTVSVWFTTSAVLGRCSGDGKGHVHAASVLLSRACSHCAQPCRWYPSFHTLPSVSGAISGVTMCCDSSHVRLTDLKTPPCRGQHQSLCRIGLIAGSSTPSPVH